MDPVANFFMRLENEDKMVDHLNMKLWEEKLEKSREKINKLVECLVEMTGCSKDSAKKYATPGYHPLPNNVKLKEAREDIKNFQTLYERERVNHQATENEKHYYYYLCDMLIVHAKKDPDWDQDKWAEFEKDMNGKYLRG